MRTRNAEHDVTRSAIAIDIWENEGGAPDRAAMGHYGRETEANEAKLVYLFAGDAARTGGPATE